jgi:hypothetical protein
MFHVKFVHYMLKKRQLAARPLKKKEEIDRLKTGWME